MRHLVGFDLDMTLIDSRPTILATYAELAEAWGIAIDLDAIAGRLGLKLEDELAHWLPEAERAAAAEEFRRRYLGLIEATTTVMRGAERALEVLRRAGDESVVVTAKHPSSALASLEAMGLRPDHLYGLRHGAEKGELLLRLGAACYLGDTPADMEAAAVAGILGVALPTGAYPAAALREAGAGVVLSSLERFPQWYRTWREEQAAAGA